MKLPRCFSPPLSLLSGARILHYHRLRRILFVLFRSAFAARRLARRAANAERKKAVSRFSGISAESSAQPSKLGWGPTMQMAKWPRDLRLAAPRTRCHRAGRVDWVARTSVWVALANASVLVVIVLMQSTGTASGTRPLQSASALSARSEWYERALAVVLPAGYPRNGRAFDSPPGANASESVVA
jgi:hypothetical protein